MMHIFVFVLLYLLSEPQSISQAAEAEPECEAPSSQHPRREATVIYHGKEMLVEGSESPFEKKTWGKDAFGNDEFYYILEQSKSVFYVPNFLNESTAQELQSFCLEQERFVRSPVRGKFSGNNGDIMQDNSIRTSESCTMVPASTYLKNPRFQAMRKDENVNPQTANIIREVDVAWDISQRAASLLSWDPESVEPLQIVRYTSPEAFYNVHHDHGDFYGKSTELRPWTVLVFLNDVSKGGYTHFPKLNLKVVPRGGDAIAWSNFVEGGKADPDMVHAGEPPAEHGVEKYAVNIWLGESSLTDNASTVAGGRWGATNKNQ